MFSIPFYLVILILAAGLVITWLLMRPDKEPSKVKKLIFTVRAILITMIILALLQFTLRWNEQKLIKPVILILLDVTESMQLINSDFSPDLVREIEKDLEKNSFQTETFVFGADTILSYGDWDGSFNFSGTDLSEPLRYAFDNYEEKNLRGVVLISDGQANSGENPLFENFPESVPVFTIGIGDTQTVQHPWIEKLEYEPVFYADSTETLRVIYSTGGSAARLTLKSETLSDSSVLVSSEDGAALRHMDFPLNFPDPGEYLIDISIRELESEKPADRKYVHLQVLPEKYKIVLVTDYPDFTSRGMVSLVHSFGSFGMSTIVPSLSKKTDWERVIGESNLIILQGEIDNSDIFQKLLNSEKPVFILIQQGMSTPQKREIERVLSGKISSLNEPLNIIVMPTENIFRFAGTLPDDNVWKLLSDLPPLNVTELFNVPDSSFLPLFTIPGRKEFPILQFGVYRNKKWLIFNGNNLWSWYYKTLNVDAHEPFITVFGNLLNWLVQPIQQQNIRIYPDRKVYNRGEKINFSGIVVDNLGRVRSDLPVELMIEGKNTRRTHRFSKESGKYQLAFTAGEADTLRYSIYIPGFEETFGTFSGEVIVTNISVEAQNLFQNDRLLKALASTNNGKYFDSKDFNPGKLTFIPKVRSDLIRREILFYFNPWYIGFILLLFFTELVIRKIYGFL